jgi:hypothetical protein
MRASVLEAYVKSKSNNQQRIAVELGPDKRMYLAKGDTKKGERTLTTFRSPTAECAGFLQGMWHFQLPFIQRGHRG